MTDADEASDLRKQLATALKRVEELEHGTLFLAYALDYDTAAILGVFRSYEAAQAAGDAARAAAEKASSVSLPACVVQELRVEQAGEAGKVRSWTRAEWPTSVWAPDAEPR